MKDKLKVGELSDELQDYMIIQNNQKLADNYEEILNKLSEIKDYMFNSQDKRLSRQSERIDHLEQRIEMLEDYQQQQIKQAETEIEDDKERKTWIKRQFAGSIIIQVMALLFAVLYIYLGLH